MTPLASFRPNIAYRVLNCPEPLIDSAIINACIRFCERTNIVRSNLSPITVAKDQFECVLVPPTGQLIVQVQRLWANGSEIFPAQEDNSDASSFVETVATVTPVTGTPRLFTEVRSGVVSFSPRPDNPYSIDARVSTKPSRSATEVEDVLYEDWLPAIESGALSQLLMSTSPWGDMHSGKLEQMRFDAAVGDAILESRRGRNRSEDVVTPVWI